MHRRSEYCQASRQDENFVWQLGTRSFCGRSDALNCERSCARENASVRDMLVSEEMSSSQVVLGRPLERLQEGSGG